MRRARKLLLGITLFTSGIGSASAAPVLVDFDTLPGGGSVGELEKINNQYSSVGVTFQAFENGALVSGPVASNQYGGAGSGRGLFNVQTTPDVNQQSDSSRTDILRMVFSGPAFNVSFVTNGYEDQTTFQAFDLGGNLLESITNSSGFGFAVNFSASGIARIDALQESDNYTYRIDDLEFELATPDASAVPEPGSLALLLTGGIGFVGGAARNRRKKALASATA